MLVTNVQVLRFVAAALVIVAHSIDLASPGAGLSNALQDFGAVGVDIFFVISGFIITRAGFLGGHRRDPRDFAIGRIVRVVPLYYLLTVPWIISGFRSGSIEMTSLLTTLTFWPAIGGETVSPVLWLGWTLSFEMLFYAAASLVLLVNRPWIVVVLAVAYFASWIAREVTSDPAFMFLGNPIILEFLMGVGIAHVTKSTPAAVARPLIVLAAAWFIVTIIVGYGGIHQSILTTTGTLSLQRALVWGVPAALLVWGSAIDRPWTSSSTVGSLVWLGGASYSMYLIHPLFLRGLDVVLSTVSMSLPWPVLVVIGTGGSIVVGALTYSLVEQPLMRLFKPKKKAPGAQSVPADAR